MYDMRDTKNGVIQRAVQLMSKLSSQVPAVYSLISKTFGISTRGMIRLDFTYSLLELRGT